MASRFKKALFLSVAFAFVTESSIAQGFSKEADNKNLFTRRLVSKIEILLGTSYISPRGPDSFEKILDTKFGFNAAIAASHEINPRFEINLKAAYENKGYKFENYQDNYDYTPPAIQRSIIDQTLHYAIGSISLRYLIDKKKRFFVTAGPYVGYLINESQSTEIYIDGNLIFRRGAKGHKSVSYKDFDFGVITGLGYNLNIRSKLSSTIQFNYNLGLVDVSTSLASPMRNTTYSLLVGIAIIKE